MDQKCGRMDINQPKCIPSYHTGRHIPHENRSHPSCRKGEERCGTLRGIRALLLQRHPLRSEIRQQEITAFVDAVHSGAFDCLFFTSALPGKIIAPLLKRYPRVIAIGPQTAGELPGVSYRLRNASRFLLAGFVPDLGEWIRGKHIGIPRADVPNPALIESISAAGGIAHEFRCYGLEPTGDPLDLQPADAILFTSAMSYAKAEWIPRPWPPGDGNRGYHGCRHAQRGDRSGRGGRRVA